MKILVRLVAFVCLAPAMYGQAGWSGLPNTQMGTVCQNGVNTCAAVINAWNSGVLDTTRNRLIIWGGGHGDYSGNEVYALNLNGTPSWERLNNSTAGGCSLDSCDGGVTPNSRHTYDGIEYMPNVDRMFVFGGSRAGNGYALQDTWTFNFANKTWQKMNPSGPIPNAVYGVTTAYDPNTGKIFLEDQSGFFSYDFQTNTYTRLGDALNPNNHHTGVIDPVRKKYVIIGGNLNETYTFDISGNGSYDKQHLATTGTGVPGDFPGLTYDPVLDRIIAIPDRAVSGSTINTVYALNLDTKVWTPITYANGPPQNTNSIGVFGRLKYVSSLAGSVLVNSVSQNAFVIRLGSTTPTEPPPPPPSTWTFCANENQQCVFTGTKQIRFGANDQYNFKTLTDGTPCTNAVFGDPIPFTAKHCDIDNSGSTPPPPPPPPPPSTWTFCANENQQCGFTGTKDVRYGANTTFNVKTLTGGTPCTNAVFGDPIPFTAKHCDYADSGTTPPPPTPSTLTVGPGKMFQTFCAAVAASKAGDTIEVSIGIYPNESCTIQQPITIKAVGTGTAHLKWGTGDALTNTAHIPNGKGILIVQASTTIEGLEFSGAKVPDGNGAGIRYEGGNLTVRKSYFHGNENGILGQGGASNTATLEDNIFEQNGTCAQGCAHNVYIGQMGKLIFSRNISKDSRDESHTLKSRASVNEVTGNTLSTKNSNGSYEADFPYGGSVLFTGNTIEQGVNSSNSTLLAYAAEGSLNPNPSLIVRNNTFRNLKSTGSFIQVAGSPAIEVTYNTFTGPGTALTGATTDLSTNTFGTAPPVDPCIADPLKITGVKWPTAQTGTRSLTWNSGTKKVKDLLFTWPGTLTVTDDRNCKATVNK